MYHHVPLSQIFDQKYALIVQNTDIMIISAGLGGGSKGVISPGFRCVVLHSNEVADKGADFVCSGKLDRYFS